MSWPWKRPREGVWRSFVSRLCVLTGKDSRSDPHGQSCAMASDLQSTLRVSQASGNTAGSFGLLPSPTRFSGRHERRGPQCRRATHRGLGSRPPLLWWRSACCGCHPSVPFAQHRRATPKRRRRQRGSAATSSEGQRDDLPRAGSFRKVSSGGPCNGDGRALE